MRLIKLLSLFSLVSIFLLPAAFCKSISDDGKVPITTSSEKAKENFLKGRDLTERLKAQESLQYFTNAIKEDPGFATAYLNRALSQPGAKEFFDDVNKAVSLADKVSEGERLQILALQAGMKADTKKQEEYLSKLVSMFPNDERAVNLLANFYFGQQEDQKAIDLYNKALAINPDFSPVYNQMGYSLRRLEKYDEAEKAFKKYTELIPDDPNPYDSYAELLLKRGKFDQSIEYYQKALKQDQYFAASRVGLAANYMYKGNYEQSRKEMQKLYDMAKGDGERRTALFINAVSYVDEGKPDAAIKEFEKQITLDEKNKDYGNISADIVTIATVLYETGKYDEALKKYRESVTEFDKSSSEKEVKDNVKLNQLVNESKIAMMKGDKNTAQEKADEYMKGVTALNNQNQIRLAHELQAILALNQNDADKCLSELSMANNQNPYNLYRMAAAYKIKGDTDKVKEYCEKAINFNQLPGMNGAYARVRAKELMAVYVSK